MAEGVAEARSAFDVARGYCYNLLSIVMGINEGASSRRTTDAFVTYRAESPPMDVELAVCIDLCSGRSCPAFQALLQIL